MSFTPDPNANLSYADTKAIASGEDVKARRELALRTDIRPEILYYLVNDPDEQVRANVALNTNTPVHADALLAHDPDCEIRKNIAHKIGDIVPSIKSSRASVQALSNSLINTLAADAAAEVRRVLSEALCELEDVPVHVIQQLARDVEASVASPILAKSPILTQDDLLEVIESAASAGHLMAIAEREGISENICDALARTGEAEAISVMLSNGTAQIREDTLDIILDQAAEHPEWHEPLVHRPRLPSKAVVRLSEFVAGSLVEVLAERTDLDNGIALDLANAVKSKLMGADVAARNAADTAAIPGRSRAEAEAALEGRALEDFRSGRLNEERVEEAIARGERPYVMAALALMTDIDRDTVIQIVESQSPRAIVALCWAAGLTMKAAIQVQVHIGRIAYKATLQPRQCGSYPLKGDDMSWQLEYFGARANRAS